MLEVETVYGPPGCGKTTEVIRRLDVAMAEGLRPAQLAFLSFSRAAAAEGAGRLKHKLGFTGTIHSWTFQRLGLIRDQVVTRVALRQFGKLTRWHLTGGNFDGSGEDDQLGQGDYLLAAWSLHRNAKIEPEEACQWIGQPSLAIAVREFGAEYTEWKRGHGLIDFDDMLEEFVRSDPEEVGGLGIRMVAIDEAQDLTPLQWDVIRQLLRVEPVGHLITAGDDDQAIYAWNGADPHGMGALHGKVTILEQSWRLPRAVHRVADAIVQTIQVRVSKAYRPRDAAGKVDWRPMEEVHNTITALHHGEDVLVLYRNHALRDEFEDVLIGAGLPYTVDSGPAGWFDGKWAKLVRIFLDLKSDRPITELQAAFLNANLQKKLRVNRPTVAQMREISAGRRVDEVVPDFPESHLHYLRRVYGRGWLFDRPTIHLSTIHGAKGREADHVILRTGMVRDPVDFDEEARVFYVGVTRAKSRLTIMEDTKTRSRFPVSSLVVRTAESRYRVSW